ncbi:MAG: hypothetical protein ACI8PB_004577 [Desulforhopalus sp.]
MANLSQEAIAMDIHGINNRNAHAFGQLKRQQPQVEQAKPENTKNTETKPTATNLESQVTSKPKGVAGLLQEEHFKGVADVRLRIVHPEKIEQAANQAAGAMLETEGQKLVSDVMAEVELIGQEFNVGEQEILDTVNEFQEKLDTDAPNTVVTQSNIENFPSVYQKAFGELIQTLSELEPVVASEDQFPSQPLEDSSGEMNSIINPEPITITTEQEEPSANEVDPEKTEFQQALAGLEDMFGGELQLIETQINEMMSLSPPSKSTENGVAYEKFFEIYQELQGSTVEGTDDTVSEVKESLDINV